MGGGASSRAQQSSIPPAANSGSPSPKSPKRAQQDSQKFHSPRVSPRLSPRPNVVTVSADRSPSGSPSAHHKDQSRRSSESSLRDDRSDGVNEENLDYLVYSAMSLGMDNEELLFNMFYFGDESGAGFRQSMNTAIEETYAAHSTGNTPYKLRPATEDSINKHLSTDINLSDIGEVEECLICQERLLNAEMGPMVMLSACRHVFHEDCVRRWFTLQNWCPICRAVISADGNEASLPEKNIHEHQGLPRPCDVGCSPSPATANCCKTTASELHDTYQTMSLNPTATF